MAGLSALALLATPVISRAQPSDDERARLHFDAGRSYYEEGAYEQALEEFSRSYELSHRAPLLANMANCEDRLGRWTDAANHLEQYARTLQEGSEERRLTERRIENLRARASARQEPSATPDVAPTPATETPAGSEGLLVPSIVLMGAGGAALIAWGVLGGLALGEESTIASGCGATASCTAEEVRAMDDLALGADISLAAGLALAAVGVVLLIVEPPRGAPSTSGAALAPFVTPDAAGIVLAGRLP